MVQSLARGLDILSIIRSRGAVTIVELAAELGVDKSTASRLVATLKEHEMVSVDPVSKKYRLGFRILYLSEGVKNNYSSSVIARPYLHKICEELHQSAHLAAMSNRKIYIVDQVLSKEAYNLAALVGQAEAWHCSAVGKCVLAFKSRSFVDDILSDYDYKAYTPRTITNHADLRRELSVIREQGYAVDDEELTPGVRCIAAPVFIYGSVRCCIGISGPKKQIPDDAVIRYAACIKKYCRLIGRELQNDPS